MNTRRATGSALTVFALSCFLAPALLGRQAVPPTAPAASRQQKSLLPKPGGGLGDGLTAQRVRHVLITDRRFDPLGVGVVSSSGTIILKGMVKTQQARDYAQSDAQKAPGVHRVINRLKVSY